MFGIVAAGRLVDMCPVDVAPSRVAFPLHDPESVKHIVVFMTGAAPFEPGFGAAIYLGWPTVDGLDINWQLLGHLSNEKPSAIFKITSTKPVDPLVSPFAGVSMVSVDPTMAQVGLAIVPLAELEFMAVVGTAPAPTASDFALFTESIARYFVDYVASFAIASPDGRESYVPVSSVFRWYETVSRRLLSEPLFWRK